MTYDAIHSMSKRRSNWHDPLKELVSALPSACFTCPTGDEESEKVRLGLAQRTSAALHVSRQFFYVDVNNTSLDRQVPSQEWLPRRAGRSPARAGRRPEVAKIIALAKELLR